MPLCLSFLDKYFLQRKLLLASSPMWYCKKMQFMSYFCNFCSNGQSHQFRLIQKYLERQNCNLKLSNRLKPSPYWVATKSVANSSQINWVKVAFSTSSVSPLEHSLWQDVLHSNEPHYIVLWYVCHCNCKAKFPLCYIWHLSRQM